MKTTTVLTATLALTASLGLADQRPTDLAGRYIGASSVQSAECLTGGSDILGEPLYGSVFGCTYHDLQKYGSMGRQIVGSGALGGIDFTWTNKETAILADGMNVSYETLLNDGWTDDGIDVAGPANVPAEKSGFVTMTGVGDFLVINSHQWNRDAIADPSAYRTHNFFNSTPFIGDFVGFGGEGGNGRIPDSTWNGHLSGNATSFIWPQIAYTDVGGTQVAHLVISSDRSDGDNTALYLRRVGFSDWETVMELGPAGYHRSFIVTSAPNSERVAIAFSGGRGDGSSTGPPISRYNGVEYGRRDNDLYVIFSDDAGATWGTLQNITMRPDFDTEGFAPHAKLSAVFDNSDTYHLIWQASMWTAYGRTFNRPARMYHWNDNTQTIRVAADGMWLPVDCEPGYQQLNIDNPQLSHCSGKLYLTYTAFAPVPQGLGDDCHTRAFSGDRIGAANGNLFVTVSEDNGYTWDLPRALLDKYTPDCDTIDGTANPDCVSAAWHSSIRYGLDVTLQNYFGVPDFTSRIDASYPPETGDYLFTQYIHDHIPGAAPLGEGGWTDNPVRTFRFACVDKVSAARVASSLPQGDLQIDLGGYSRPDDTMQWVLENIGDQNVTDLSVSVSSSDPPSFATVGGIGTTLNSGAENSDTGMIHLALSMLAFGDTGNATITVSGSFAESPMTFNYMYFRAESCCDTPGDAANSGGVSIGAVTYLIARIFSGGPPPPCCEEGDPDGSGSIDIGDVVYLIARIFSGGPAPVCGPAGMTCGVE